MRDVENKNQVEASIQWAHHSVLTEGKSIKRFLGRIVIVDDLVGYKVKKSTGGVCQFEETTLVAFVNSSRASCEIETIEKNRTRRFDIKTDPTAFESIIDPYCEEPAVTLDSPDMSGKLGYVALTCQKIKNGYLFTIDHSSNYRVKGSSLHEDFGKFESFKSYKNIGVGKLSNQEDFEINSFALLAENDPVIENDQRFKIRKKSFLFTRQSPFEIEVGIGLTSANFSSDLGQSNNISGRGVFGLLYDYQYNWILNIRGAADITSFDDGSNIEKAAYIFLESNATAGFRWNNGLSSVIELVTGLSFAKYSFQLGSERRLYSRRGINLQGTYKKKVKDRTEWWTDLSYTYYLASSPNSLISLRVGKRWGDSKFSPWFSYQRTQLEDENEGGSKESGNTFVLGTSLDF